MYIADETAVIPSKELGSDMLDWCGVALLISVPNNTIRNHLKNFLNTNGRCRIRDKLVWILTGR